MFYQRQQKVIPDWDIGANDRVRNDAIFELGTLEFLPLKTVKNADALTDSEQCSYEAAMWEGWPPLYRQYNI